MSWPEVAIESICETTSGGTPSRERSEFYRGEIPWVKSGELRENLIVATEERISEKAVSSSSAKILPPGTLLIAMYGATVGRMATLGVHAATNQAVCALRPRNGNLDGRFLFHSLQSKIPELLSRRNGGAQPNISQAVIRSLQVPLPPLEEQKRIAAILDKADAIRHKREQAIKLADEFLRSLFLDMFGDPTQNNKKWSEAPLASLSDIQSGITKGRRLNGSPTREVPYMRVANVLDGRIDISDIKLIVATEEEIRRFALSAGDLLLTEGGDPDKLGRGAVWHGELDECIHQNHIFRVRANRDLVIPEYLSALISSRRGKRYFLRSAKQTTGIATINKNQLSAFPVLLPPLHLQRLYRRAVERHKVLAEHMQRASKHVEQSVRCLMHRAFRCEL